MASEPQCTAARLEKNESTASKKDEMSARSTASETNPGSGLGGQAQPDRAPDVVGVQRRRLEVRLGQRHSLERGDADDVHPGGAGGGHAGRRVLQRDGA